MIQRLEEEMKDFKKLDKNGHLVQVVTGHPVLFGVSFSEPFDKGPWMYRYP